MMEDKKELEALRKTIGETDEKLKKLILERKKTVEKIGDWKRRNAIPTADEKREKEILDNQLKGCTDADEKLYLGRIYRAIFAAGQCIEGRKNIYLSGMMGCGKSTIGRLLAEKTGMPFLDLDEAIEEKTGMKISEYFEHYGEKAFREKETEVLLEETRTGGRVIALGGGSVMSSANFAAMQKSGVIIYIEREIRRLLESIEYESRPLLKEGKNAVLTIFAGREPLYRMTADYIVDNNRDTDACVSDIMKLIM